MKYAVEMGPGAMIYIPSFVKIGSDIQKLERQIYRQHSGRISLLLFLFLIKKIGKRKCFGIQIVDKGSVGSVRVFLVWSFGREVMEGAPNS
jgi:hypothetical protein